MTTKTSRLTGRLVRSLRAWEPKTDGPMIAVATLVEAFPFLPGTIWYGALADTRADGNSPRKTPGVEGRTYQGWRICVLARGLERWVAAQNPLLDEAIIGRIVGELVALEEERRLRASSASAEGVRRFNASKREAAAAGAKPKRKPSKVPTVTSDALFKVW